MTTQESPNTAPVSSVQLRVLRGSSSLLTLNRSSTRVLYHFVRADFLERVRRYSFLVTLALTVYLAYCCVTGKVVVRLDEYRGVYNSAWVGCVMALVAATFLSLFGFYIVKGSIQRDQQTRVGQILATTPMTKIFYTVAKMISNFAVLASMIAVMAMAAIVMQMLKAEDPHVHLWPLLSPLVIFALPAMAFTGALAIFFETIPVFRGGIGNVIYFFLWTALLAVPVGSLENGKVGDGPIFLRRQRHRLHHEPDAAGSEGSRARLHQGLLAHHRRHKDHKEISLERPPSNSRALPQSTDQPPRSPGRRSNRRHLFPSLRSRAGMAIPKIEVQQNPPASVPIANGLTSVAPPQPANQQASTPLHLTPLARSQKSPITLLPKTVLAELKLMLKGHQWWWYIVAAGLFIASVASPLNVSRGVAIAALLWPILVWSQMGTRESRFNTASLIFSSERSLIRQLPAVWIAGVIVAALTNAGLAIRLLIARDHQSLLAWLACTLFIPSLALALGIWSGTSKVFEAVYTVWWYVGPAHFTPGLDFLGASPASARASLYLLMTAALLVASYLGRRSKLAYA